MYAPQHPWFTILLTNMVQHFAYWYMKFHNNSNWDPIISADALPAAPKAMRALFDYISETTWEHRLISGWFKALDPETWEQYHTCYQKLRKEGKLRHLDLGANDWGCFLGHALLINIYVDPHKDSGDVKRGWVFNYPWMDFEGGDAVYVDLALRFKQRAGDFIMSRSCVLTHMTMLITAGQRWGNTWFTKADILETPIADNFCQEPGCSASYTSPNGLQWHRKRYHIKDSPVEKDTGGLVVDDGMLAQQGEDAEFAGLGMDDEMLFREDDETFPEEGEDEGKMEGEEVDGDAKMLDE